MPNRKYISTDTLSNKLGKHPETIRRLRRSGKLPFHARVIDGTLYWVEEEVDQAMDATIQPASKPTKRRRGRPTKASAVAARQQ